MSKPGKRRGSKRPQGEEPLSPIDRWQSQTRSQQQELVQNSPSNFGFFRTPSTYSSSTVPSAETNYHTQAPGGWSTQTTTSRSTTAHIPAGKVAIPALKHTNPNGAFKSYKKGRTSHACDNCRKAKAGCTGGMQCSRCKANGSLCTYSDGKRDREKKEMTKLSAESNQFRHLSRFTAEVMEALRRIRNDPNLSLEEVHEAIDEVLSMTQEPHSPDEQYDSPSPSELDIELDDEMEVAENDSGSLGPPSNPLDEGQIHPSSSSTLMTQQQPQHGYFTPQMQGAYTESWNNMFMNNLASSGSGGMSNTNIGGPGVDPSTEMNMGIGMGGVGVRVGVEASGTAFDPRIRADPAASRGGEGEYRRASLPVQHQHHQQQQHPSNQPPF